MRKRILVMVISFLMGLNSKAQNDSVFTRIMTSAKEFKLDTSIALMDKFTEKVQELRYLRSGFNINEALRFKFEEALSKKEMSQEAFDLNIAFFYTGHGKKLLDNAMIAIYKNHFTYKDVKKLVKFYKTSTGQKMGRAFPILMLESLRAAEIIAGIYAADQGK